jgi:hypothetical protein
MPLTTIRASLRWLIDLPVATRIRNASGIDRPVFYTVVARGWSAFAGPISLIFVAQFLSKEEQGFYYTFSSVLALQIFFELGLAYVIMQSASHEKAHLEWSKDDRVLTGDPRAKARLASLLQLAAKWYVAIAVFAAVVLATGRILVFPQLSASGSSGRVATPVGRRGAVYRPKSARYAMSRSAGGLRQGYRGCRRSTSGRRLAAASLFGSGWDWGSSFTQLRSSRS